MKIQVLFCLLLISLISNGQSDCYNLDKKTNIAYNKNDSFLYSGICQGFYDNNQLQFACQFDSGFIKSCKHWDKKGNLLDSVRYFNGFDKMRVFQIDKNKIVNAIIDYRLPKEKSDTIRTYEIDEELYFYDNGNKRIEMKYFHDDKNRYLFKQYYKNGNLKCSYIAYDSNPFLNRISTINYDSVYTEYSKDGKKKSEILYKNGEQIGEEKRYQEDKFNTILITLSLVGGFFYLILK